VAAQFQGVTLERSCIAAPFVSEVDVDLSGLAAVGAPQTLDGQDDRHPFRADWQRLEPSSDLALPHDPSAAAVAAAERVRVLFDHELDPAAAEVGPQIAVSTQTPTVVQHTRGHVLISSLKLP
jgi:hypothetical protein